MVSALIALIISFVTSLVLNALMTQNLQNQSMPDPTLEPEPVKTPTAKLGGGVVPDAKILDLENQVQVLREILVQPGKMQIFTVPAKHLETIMNFFSPQNGFTITNLDELLKIQAIGPEAVVGQNVVIKVIRNASIAA